jgi:hypothetical protein
MYHAMTNHIKRGEKKGKITTKAITPKPNHAGHLQFDSKPTMANLWKPGDTDNLHGAFGDR